MFGLSIHESSSYSGDRCYRYVEPLITRGSGTLKVVSPFISIQYAKMLLDAAKKRKIYVITSSGRGIEDSGALKILMKGRKHFSFLPIFYISMVAIGFYLFDMYLYSAAALALIIGIAYHNNSHNRTTASNIKVKAVTSRFIHEKLYIAEDRAITGSANLTFSGMHRNIEHIDIIKESRRVADLSHHFDELWSKY